MNLSVDRFLALTALIATAASVACTEEVDTKTDPDSGIAGTGGGSAGTGGSSAGAGGTAGEAGSAGAGGGSAGAAATGGGAGAAGSAGAGASGGGGAGGGDAGQECLDTGAAIDCSTLPFAATLCGVDPDAGAEGSPATGALVCDYLDANARAGVAEAMHACLAAIPGSVDACSSAHDDAVQVCVDDVLPRACDAPPVTIDGGSFGCAEVVASCPADADAGTGLTMDVCEDALNAFTDAARLTILQCYNDSGVLADGGASTNPCEDDFFACVFNF